MKRKNDEEKKSSIKTKRWRRSMAFVYSVDETETETETEERKSCLLETSSRVTVYCLAWFWLPSSFELDLFISLFSWLRAFLFPLQPIETWERERETPRARRRKWNANRLTFSTFVFCFDPSSPSSLFGRRDELLLIHLLTLAGCSDRPTVSYSNRLLLQPSPTLCVCFSYLFYWSPTRWTTFFLSIQSTSQRPSLVDLDLLMANRISSWTERDCIRGADACRRWELTKTKGRNVKKTNQKHFPKENQIKSRPFLLDGHCSYDK